MNERKMPATDERRQHSTVRRSGQEYDQQSVHSAVNQCLHIITSMRMMMPVGLAHDLGMAVHHLTRVAVHTTPNTERTSGASPSGGARSSNLSEAGS